MLAEEFGYQISPQPATQITPNIRAVMDDLVQKATEKRPKGQQAAGWVILAIIAIIFILHPLLIIPLVLLAAGAALLVWRPKAWRRDSSDLRCLREAMPVVLSGPWQTWPCRLQAITGEATLRRVLLLSPDGTVASEFHAAVPSEVWTGMADGRGLVWFVGDLRFGGIASLPGGDPLWWTGGPVTPSSPSPPSSGMQRVIEEELARKAIGFAFDRWLK